MKDTDWEILYELYKNPNMTRVANLLYITQPSLTKRLQYMETEFQVAIVNRTPKGLEFTKEGAYLGEQARRYLEFMKETRKHLDEMKMHAGGSITIGTSYTYAKYVLSDILLKYKMTHQNIELNVVTEQSNVLFRKMLDKSIDVAFIRGDYEGEINQTLLGRSTAYLVTQDPVDLNDLPNMQGIDYKTNDRTKELIDGWWNDQFHIERPSEMMIGYIDVAWQLIHKGMGYTLCFLPEGFVNEYDLCLTPLTYTDGRPVQRNTWFLYTKEKRIAKNVEDFIQYIETEIAMKSTKREEN